MKRTRIHYLLTAIGIGLTLFTGCTKKKTFPVEPEIKYSNFVATGDSAKLYLTFTDGDGDLGLAQSDTGYDFFITYYELRKGVWTVVNLPAPFSYRMPITNKSGKKKAQQGEIIINVTPYYYNPFSKYDTIRYEFYIKDKALHESNHEFTPDYAVIAPPH
jgi:hypothetical protein